MNFTVNDVIVIFSIIATLIIIILFFGTIIVETCGRTQFIVRKTYYDKYEVVTRKALFIFNIETIFHTKWRTPKDPDCYRSVNLLDGTLNSAEAWIDYEYDRSIRERDELTKLKEEIEISKKEARELAILKKRFQATKYHKVTIPK